MKYFKKSYRSPRRIYKCYKLKMYLVFLLSLNFIKYCYVVGKYWLQGIFKNQGSTLLSLKRLKKIGTVGLGMIKHFYLSQPITLHPKNSIFFYLRTYPE